MILCLLPLPPHPNSQISKVKNSLKAIESLYRLVNTGVMVSSASSVIQQLCGEQSRGEKMGGRKKEAIAMELMSNGE